MCVLLLCCQISGTEVVYAAVKLNGTTAIITGSASPLGAAIALKLAEAGCSCVCHYHHSRADCIQLTEQIRRLGAGAIAVGGDLTEEQTVEKIFEQAEQIGTVRILINSASVFERTPLMEITSEKIERIFRLNFTAPVLMSRSFFSGLKQVPREKGSVSGKIINIADVAAVRAWAQYCPYCSSRGALVTATKSLAKELAPGICVNAVAPGLITWPAEFDESEKKRQLSLIPMRRIGNLSEVTAVILFLLENDYITGQLINIDGGRCI